MGLSGLAQLNIELTSKCDKRTLCAFCGHQDESVHPHLQMGDMDFALLQRLRFQLDPGIVISFHRDGEPTAYPRLRDALDLFSGFTTSLVTHGLSLANKADDIIGRVTTCTVSVFRGDPDAVLQIHSLRSFLSAKGDRAPQVQVKIVGDLSQEEAKPYEELGVRIIRRLIHVPVGNSKYAHRHPTVPEVGVCLDFLHRPTIDWRGRVFVCNRLDPADLGYLGSLEDSSLGDLWTGEKRMTWLKAHQAGRRDLASPLCKTCEFWGVASE
jgi:hypothetical protein